MAAQEYNLTVETENTIQIEEDNFVTKILINNVKNRASCEYAMKEFTGKMALTKKQSLQNAYQTTLTFLEKEKMVIIDDYNAPRGSQLEEDVLYHSSWHMLFEDKVAKLKASINATETTLRSFLAAFDSACDLLLHSCEPPPSASKKRRFRDTTATSSATDESIGYRLSQSFIKLRAQILSLLGKNHPAEAPVGPAAV